ncbi:MAG TPA: hypothetical protein VJO33_18100 [Gemmatimonadaceae bacterium]|nr:hypothetical protein [Gemmatimonadaceae bacterium]
MSQNRMRFTLAVGLMLPMLAAAPISIVRAQSQREAIIVLTDSLPDSTATATIVREPGPRGRTMVLLRSESADPATLATALVSLTRSRQRLGDLPPNEVVINLHGHRAAASLSVEEQRITSDYVSRLRNAALQDLPGYGRARTLVVPLPPVSVSPADRG